MKKIAYIILIALAFAACTEKIDVELDETYTRLVVDGRITDDTTEHVIRLTKTTSYFYNQPAPRVEGALLTINDGEESFVLTETEPGIYKTEKMAGIIGRTYTLNIELPESIDGHSQYSASDKLMPVGEIDSIQMHYISQWENWEIKLFAQEPPSTDFYMFRWGKNGVMLTDTINEVNVSDDKFFNGSYSNGIGVGWFDDERSDEKLQVGDTVFLVMSTLTETYANFIWEIQNETGYNNPLFGGPPANVSSNISHGALGFFAAFPNRSASTIVGAKE